MRNEHLDAFQAATKVSIEDARAQWTTHDNLNQWFDDAMSNLLRTGLDVDEAVLDEEGGIVSELLFLSDTEQRIINMDEIHHDFCQSLVTSVGLGLCPIITRPFRGAPVEG